MCVLALLARNIAIKSADYRYAGSQRDALLVRQVLSKKDLAATEESISMDRVMLDVTCTAERSADLRPHLQEYTSTSFT